MNWFLVAILGPFLWSITNHIDKFLLSKHLKGIGKGALILYSTFFGIFVLPIAWYMNHDVLNINISTSLILIICGALSSIGIFLYLFALEDDEASTIVPFFQTIPVFGYILGWLILKESLSLFQIVGGLVIILGALILSFEIGEENKIKFKAKTSFLMILSSFLFALYEILFKVGAIDVGFWKATFWQYVGLFLFGITLFGLIKKFRLDFVYLIRTQNWRLLKLNILNESISILGNSFYNFALLLAPAALVMMTTGYQPVFVFFLGLLLTIFFPHIAKEKMEKKHVVHKLSAIIVVVLGTYLLYL